MNVLARRLGTALLAGLLFGLQGCGGIAYTRAAYLDQQRVKRLHRECAASSPGGLCDRELVLVTVPPVQSDCKSLGRPGCPKPEPLPHAEAEARKAKLQEQARKAELEAQAQARAAASPPAVALRAARDTTELARVLLPMAYLSNVVYHRHETGKPAAVRNEPSACLRGQAFSMHPLELPEDGSQGGWARLADPASCAAEAGLFYDTYIREPQKGAAFPQAVQVAIVFRGTENEIDQFGYDWTDNFLSSFGLSPQQYTLAIERLKLTMAALETLRVKRAEQNQTVEIYAAGHSLGGGLAQQAAYLYRDILAVFAFNTSSVTNWTQLALWNEGIYIQNQGPIVYRVEQQGEFLDYLRFVTTRASSRMLGRTDIEFNFGPPEPFSAHSIATLTCHLAVRAAESGAMAAGPLGYTPNEAEALTLTRKLSVPGLGCDAGTLETICRESRSYLPRLAPRCPVLAKGSPPV